MKRCPKCNRNFSTETQKFCTHDGAPLVTAESGREAIQIINDEKVKTDMVLMDI